MEELRCNIAMIPVEFGAGQELRKNDPLSEFHIAFNFIGPVADPKPYYKASQNR